MTVRVHPAGGEIFRSFTVFLAQGGDYVTTILYHPETNTVIVDRNRSGWPEKVLNQRAFEVRECAGEITLRVVLDRYSMELFVNDGEQAASYLIFSPEEADSISFEADGDAVIDVEKFSIEI